MGSAIRRYSTDQTCVIVLSNSYRTDAGRISRDLAAILFGKHYELPQRHRQIHLSPAIYDSYVGRYELSRGIIAIVTREGDYLTIQGSGDAKVRLLPESQTRFFPVGLDVAVNFVNGPGGKSIRLVLQQGGRDIPAPRID